MTSSNFDRHAANYRAQIDRAAAGTGTDVDALAAGKARLLLGLLAEYGLNPKQCRALDAGCGIGILSGHLAPSVAGLTGVDVSGESVALAARAVPAASFQVVAPGPLPFESGEFDLVFATCVLHHVPLPDRAAFTAELARVVRPGGLVAILEHNPLNPVTRMVVGRCPLDEDAVLLRAGESRALLRRAGLGDLGVRFYGFIPWRGQVVEAAERLLGWLPLGAQYLCHGRMENRGQA